MYASFLEISSPPLRAAQSPTLPVGSPVSKALHLDIFHQPLGSRFFDNLNRSLGLNRLNQLMREPTINPQNRLPFLQKQPRECDLAMYLWTPNYIS